MSQRFGSRSGMQSPSQMSGKQADGTSRISFAELTNVLEPDGSLSSVEASSWRSIIDRNEQLIIFYQVDYLRGSPNISKAVRIRRDRDDMNEDKLVPVVFISQALQSSYVENLLGRKYLSLYDDLTAVLDSLQDGEASGNTVAYDGYGSDGNNDDSDEDDFRQQSLQTAMVLPSCSTSDASSYLPGFEEGKGAGQLFEFQYLPPQWTENEQSAALPESEPEDMGTGDVMQRTSETSSAEYAVPLKRKRKSAAKKSGKKWVEINALNAGISLLDIVTGETEEPPTVPAKRKAAGPSKSLSSEQKLLLKKIVKEMHTPGKHKKELLPGSGRYLAVDRLSLLRSKVHKTPLTDAVQLAMAFIGPPQDAIRVFVGSYFGLKAAFGADFVADVAGWVNAHHPAITSGKEQPLTCDMLLSAFSKRMTHYRKSLPSWKKCAIKKHSVGRSNNPKEAEPKSFDLTRSASEPETSLSGDEATDHSDESSDDEPVVAKKVRKSARSTRKEQTSNARIEGVSATDVWTDETKRTGKQKNQVSVEQERLLNKVNREMKTPAKHKQKLFPGSEFYISVNRLSALESQKTCSPTSYAGKVVLAFIGSHQTAIQIFTGRNFGLKSAFDEDFLVDVTGWVNSQHPKIVSGESPPLTPAEVCQAFSRKVQYLRSTFPSWKGGKDQATTTAQKHSNDGLQDEEVDEASLPEKVNPKTRGSLNTAVSSLSASQKELLKKLHEEMSTPGKNKKEFPVGSGRYINAVRLDMVKSSPHRSPEVWAVEIVLKFMGSQQNALRIFQGKGMGLYAAFGSDFVADITGWVNMHHGGVTSGAAEPITCSDVTTAFSKRLGYWRKQLPSWKSMPDKEEVDDDLNDESDEE